MSERKLASIRKISSIASIEGADRIIAYQVDGWWVVDSKDKYQVGDLVVYIEPDAFVPTELASFLSKGKEPREYLGIKGEKLRTIRLKGQLSQGLLLPLSVLGNPEETFAITDDSIGADVTEQLGILKWEAPIPAQLAGQVKGNFPSNVIKPDAERVQNLVREIAKWDVEGVDWEVTEKIEGTSFTAGIINGEFIVCSRNVNLKEDETNLYWKIAREYDIEAKLRGLMLDNVVIQGEIYGMGVQGNIYNLQQTYLGIFTVQKNGQYVSPIVRQNIISEMKLPTAPVLNNAWKIDGKSVDDILKMADGFSVLGTQGVLREGLVFKSADGKHIWKAVSNKYLEKQK